MRRRRASGPLSQPDFARFFWAAAVSNAGSLMQNVTVPFVIYRMTNSAAWLGAAALVGQVPTVVLNIFSGPIADRFDRRQILIVTQSAQMLLALFLWGLWVSGRASLTGLLVNLALTGVANGINTTTWQSFVPLLVPHHHLVAALRLNTLQFAIGRMAGPLLAAVVLDWLGPGAAFFFNAASFLLVIAVLFSVRPRPAPRSTSGATIDQLREGWRYMLAHRSLSITVLTLFVAAFFGLSLVQLAPAFAKEQFHARRSAVGLLVGAAGAGGLIGTLAVAVAGERLRRSTLATVGLATWVGGLALVVATRRLPVGIAGFTFAGFSHVWVAMGLNQSVQVQVPEAFRGRVMSIYLQALFVGVPLGAFVLGWASQHIGIRETVLCSIVIMSAYWSVTFTFFGRLELLDSSEPTPSSRSRSREPGSVGV